MESNNNKFKILSSASVARLSLDKQMRYFENLIENIESEEEETIADLLPSSLNDESDITISYPTENADDSDINVSAYPVELGHAGENADDSDIEVSAYPVEVGHAGDSDNDFCIDNNDEVEVSVSEEGHDLAEACPCEDGNFFLAKDGTKWNKTAPQLQRIRQQNIFRESRFVGPHPKTKNLSISETFFALMHPIILSIICRNTNRKGKAVYENLEKSRAASQNTRKYVWEDITEEELSAYLGLLITMGSHHSNSERLEVLWQSKAFPLYRATLSSKRFLNISRLIRFDQQITRNERSLTDKAAPISEIFQMLNSNLQQSYRPGENLTVDEQLFPFRGRTKFTQYIPSKPAKYGIKLWWVCDAKSYYPLTGQIYTGKSGSNREQNQGERVVKDLVKQYKNTGRNVTCDNFFTSLSLANALSEWNLSMVGTLKKNKPYLPSDFKPSSQRAEYSTIFGYGENRTLCSYVPKKNKAVSLLSTMPCDDTISEIKKKPNIILFYNKTKGGVDVMDHMLTEYSTKRKTNRWPLSLFYNMLDISALAAYILYSENNPSKFKSKRGGRRLFLQELGEQLCKPIILKGAQIPRVLSFFPTKNAIECIMGVPIESLIKDRTEYFVPDEDDRGHSKVKGACYICYRENNKRKRSTRKACCLCKKAVCIEHSKVQTKCTQCLKE